MITSDQLKEIKERCNALKRYLDIDGKQMQYESEGEYVDFEEVN